MVGFLSQFPASKCQPGHKGAQNRRYRMRRVPKNQSGKPDPNHLIDQASRAGKKKDDVQYRFPMEFIGKHRGRDFNSEIAISGEKNQ